MTPHPDRMETPVPHDPDTFLAACTIEPAVSELRPDYRAALLVVEGLDPASDAGTERAEAMLVEAEQHARGLLADSPVEELAHIAAWREAYRAFGAKPQRTRNSLEALTRRAGDGLPRINPLTDIYNAVSVRHQVPIGGEDLDAYVGAARLVRATGDEHFATVVSGEPAVEHPAPGEVVWCDDDGVTCRRWNWRQGPRTALSTGTTRALFILDALGPMSDDALTAAVDELASALGSLGEQVTVSRRVLAAG